MNKKIPEDDPIVTLMAILTVVGLLTTIIGFGIWTYSDRYSHVFSFGLFTLGVVVGWVNYKDSNYGKDR